MGPAGVAYGIGLSGTPGDSWNPTGQTLVIVATLAEDLRTLQMLVLCRPFSQAELFFSSLPGHLQWARGFETSFLRGTSGICESTLARDRNNPAFSATEVWRSLLGSVSHVIGGLPLDQATLMQLHPVRQGENSR